MKEITRQGREAKAKADAEREARIAAGEEAPTPQYVAPAEEAEGKAEPTEKAIYDKALAALEEKKRKLLAKKAEKAKADALAAAAAGGTADAEDGLMQPSGITGSCTSSVLDGPPGSRSSRGYGVRSRAACRSPCARRCG